MTSVLTGRASRLLPLSGDFPVKEKVSECDCGAGEREREKEKECVCMCVSVCERARVRMCVSKPVKSIFQCSRLL